MKHYIFVYPNCVMYEVILLAYFLRAADQRVVYVGESLAEIRTYEGFIIRPEACLADLAVEKVTSFTLPGGDALGCDHDQIVAVVNQMYHGEKPVFAICGAKRWLEESDIPVETLLQNEAGILLGKHVVYGEPQLYVDFALECGKMLEIYQDEEDYQETVTFFKEFKA